MLVARVTGRLGRPIRLGAGGLRAIARDARNTRQFGVRSRPRAQKAHVAWQRRVLGMLAALAGLMLRLQMVCAQRANTSASSALGRGVQEMC